MAQRRMFDKSFSSSDGFMDLPLTAQALYFHLGVNADDDGFLNNAKSICRMIGATQEDLKTLCDKGFIFIFDSGVIALIHWNVNNAIRGDRYKETIFLKEKNEIRENENREYIRCMTDGNQMTTKWQPNDNQVTTIGIHRIDKNRTDKNREEESREEESREEECREADGREDKGVAAAAEACEKMFGIITDSMRDKIKGYINEGAKPDMLIEIFNEACENGKPTFHYAEAIIKDKLSKGIKTLGAYFQAKEEYRRGRTKTATNTVQKSPFNNYDDPNSVDYAALEEEILDQC